MPSGCLAPPEWRSDTENEQSVESRLSHGELHRVLRLAAIAYGLPDAILVTGHALLRYVPRDAEQPISPVRVQDLADERGCDPRTIRSHIRRLEAYGLVIDRSAGGGRRMIQRRRGRIVVLQGIDFSPMLAAAEAIGLAALEAEAELDERRQLAAKVSELKRRLREAVVEHKKDAPAARATAALDACPRRHRTLALRELAVLVTRLELAVGLLAEPADADASRILASDRSDKIVRPYTTEKSENSVCSHAPPPTRDQRGTDPLRHITLPMLAAALPFDWRVRIETSGSVSWPNLVADAASVERGGIIRCPAAWVRAMAARAETEPLRLSRNLFGLLHRRPGESAPCPAPAFGLAPQQSTRSPCLAS